MRSYWYWGPVFILLPGHRPARAGNLNIAFRYDDCSARSNGLRELALLDLFRSREAGITFAVIPFVSEGDGHSLEKQPSLRFPEERAAHLRPDIMDGTLEAALAWMFAPEHVGKRSSRLLRFLGNELFGIFRLIFR